MKFLYSFCILAGVCSLFVMTILILNLLVHVLFPTPKSERYRVGRSGYIAIPGSNLGEIG